MFTLGGMVAERLFTGRTDWPVSRYTDTDNAVDTASYFTRTPDETSAFVDWMWERTKAILEFEPHSKAIHTLSLELLEKREIKGRDAAAIIKGVIQEHVYPSQPGHLGLPSSRWQRP